MTEEVKTSILSKIQAELRVGKNNRNDYGHYNYRSAEDILKAAKPLLQKYGATIYFITELVEFMERGFMKVTVKYEDPEQKQEAVGYAQMGTHKGMSAEQDTGSSNSYAKKYALQNLFLIDDSNDDPDAHDNRQATGQAFRRQPKKQAPPTPFEEAEKKFLNVGDTKLTVNQAIDLVRKHGQGSSADKWLQDEMKKDESLGSLVEKLGGIW